MTVAVSKAAGQDLTEVSETLAEAFFTDPVLSWCIPEDHRDEKHPKEPHFYLFAIGTRPPWQGQGIGSALLWAVLDGCDETGTPAYLEATSERNKRLYLQHGFEITDEIHLRDSPPVWCMWRSAG